MIDVNITSLTRFTYRLLPHLREFQLGAILNVSSIASFLPLPKLA